jgi:chromate transporter
VSYLILFLEFAKIGLFAVGGGLATVPFLFQFAKQYSYWVTTGQIPDMLAVVQILPGAIGVNLAAYTGLHAASAPGAFAAAAGLIAPSILIITLVARFFDAFKQNPYVQAVFKALRPAAFGLLAAAGFGVWKLALFNAGTPGTSRPWYAYLQWKECALFALLFTGIVTLKKHPALYIALGACAGILFQMGGP